MDVSLRKNIKYIRYLIALCFVAVMVFVSEYMGYKEIIFPEILALATSCWVVEKTPWNCSKLKILLLMSLSSFFGVLVTTYVNTFVIVQVLLCLIFCALLLNIFKTNLLPLISASILPVYLKTETIVYPISVTFLTVGVILGIIVLEKFKLKAQHKDKICNWNSKNEFLYWLKLSLLLIVLTLIPYNTHNLFFIAPPLVVSFVEFSKSKNKSMMRALKVILLLFIAAILGVVLKFLFSDILSLSLTISTILSSVIMFYAFEKVGMLFHPAGAIMLIPLLLPNSIITYYPIQILIGSFAIIFTAKYCFKN